MPEQSEIKFIAATDDLSSIYFPHCPIGAHLFMTLTHDNVASFWHVKNGSLASLPEQHDMNSTDLWLTVAKFHVEGKVAKIDTDAFGKLAIISQAETQENNFTVSIYGNEATGLEMRKEFSLTFGKQQRIVDTDWLFSSDGQHLLAVALHGQVFIYCQETKKSHADELRWRRLREISWPLPEPITTVCWLRTGALLVSSDRTMMIFGKWLERDHNAQVLAEAEGVNPNIFSLASRKNGRLPDHHPLLLIHYLIWGKCVNSSS